MQTGVLFALLSAALFGASTPFAKHLTTSVSPVMLAALLYLGSGIGLACWFGGRRLFLAARNTTVAPLRRGDFPWLAGAIVSGGVAGPVLLMIGLTITPASSASLLLNLEGVLTAMLAWFVFKENFDKRIFAGMVFIVVAGAVLSWSERPELGVPWGPLAIIAACFCWAVDNNLTRKVSASDPVQIACLKGLVEQRRPAAEARLLYAETPASQARHARHKELRKLAPVSGSNLKGRPAKCDERLIRSASG